MSRGVPWCPSTSRGRLPDSLVSTPPTPTASAGAQKRKAEQTPETDTVARGGQRTALTLTTRGAAEYELIWLLQQRLRAVHWPHWHLRCMQPLLVLGRGMGVVTCQAFITLTRQPEPLSVSVSRALHVHEHIDVHVLNSCVLCLVPPAVDLLEAVSRCVCTRWGLLHVFAYIYIYIYNRYMSHLCCFRSR